MIVKLLIEAGDMKPGPAIAQKLGPMGINMGKVISQVNEATKGFKGMKVPVDLDVNVKTKNFSVNVYSPPAAELIKKELGIEKASGEAKKLKAGNLAIEQIIKIAKIKSPNMTSGSLRAAVRSIVGSCASLGILVENKEAKEVEKEISEGKYESEIKHEKEDLSEEKRKEISEYFVKLKQKQEELLKKEEEAKKAEEAAKAAATPAPGQATAAAATPGTAATGAVAGKAAAMPAAAAAKKEEKPAKKK